MVNFLLRFGSAAAYENDAHPNSSDGCDARRMGNLAYFPLLMRWFAHAKYHDGLSRIALNACCGPGGQIFGNIRTQRNESGAAWQI